MNAQPQSAPAWRGFHHIAILTPDLNATLHFYGDILGMEVGQVFPAREGRPAHCFIKPGGEESLGLHIFEYPDAQIFTYEGGIPRGFAVIPGFVQHIAFALPDEAAALALRERLEGHGVTLTPINTLGTIRNFLFTDNNGNLLEAAWPNQQGADGSASGG